MHEWESHICHAENERGHLCKYLKTDSDSSTELLLFCQNAATTYLVKLS